MLVIDFCVAEKPNCGYNTACQSPADWRDSGRGAARLARLHGVQEVGGSNPLAPTDMGGAELQPPIYGGLFHVYSHLQDVVCNEIQNVVETM